VLVLAGLFFAVVFLAVLLEAVLLEALLFEAGAFLAAEELVDLLAVDLLAVDLLAVDLLAVDLAAVFLAGAFFGAVVLLEEPLLFLAVEEPDFFAVVFAVVFAGVDLVVEDFFAVVDFEAVVFAGADFLAVAPAAAAAARRTPGGFGIVAAVSRGSFFAPEMTSLSSLPAENFGTAFFFDFIRSPVCGLRTQRALRTAFSKEPKPVIATFSPRATSRVMVSSTDSSAWAACLRFPS
jgi:hypothetical protein